MGESTSPFIDEGDVLLQVREREYVCYKVLLPTLSGTRELYASITLSVSNAYGRFLPCSPCRANNGAYNTVDAQRHVGGALPCLSGMGVDGAHNTVGQMSAPITLLGFCHARKVVGYPSDMPCWYCPAGVQGTVLGIVVDLSVLFYLLRPFSGPYRAGVPGRSVPVGSDCANRRRAVSRGLMHPRSEMRVRVGSGVWLGLRIGEAGQSRK